MVREISLVSLLHTNLDSMGFLFEAVLPPAMAARIATRRPAAVVQVRTPLEAPKPQEIQSSSKVAQK